MWVFMHVMVWPNWRRGGNQERFTSEADRAQNLAPAMTATFWLCDLG